MSERRRPGVVRGMAKTLRETSIEPIVESSTMELETRESFFSRLLHDESSTVISEETSKALAELALDLAIDGKATDGVVETALNSVEVVNDVGWLGAMQLCIENPFGIEEQEVSSEDIFESSAEPLAIEQFVTAVDDVEEAFSASELWPDIESGVPEADFADSSADTSSPEPVYEPDAGSEAPGDSGGGDAGDGGD